jgi:hypothetical protein
MLGKKPDRCWFACPAFWLYGFYGRPIPSHHPVDMLSLAGQTTQPSAIRFDVIS